MRNALNLFSMFDVFSPRFLEVFNYPRQLLSFFKVMNKRLIAYAVFSSRILHAFSPERTFRCFNWNPRRNSSALIPVLLNTRCPAAVTVAVISGIVLSLYGMLIGRSFAHVGVKYLETGQPFIAHSYSSSSIVAVVLIFWIIAPALNPKVGLIFSCFGKSVGVISLRGRIGLKATAAPSVTDFEANRWYLMYFSALAFGNAYRFLVSNERARNSEATEYFSRDGFSVRTNHVSLNDA